MKLRNAIAAITIATAGAFATVPAQAAPFADVVVLMDESGSMSGDQAWMKGAITSLDTGLIGAGLTPNQYGSVGFAVGGGPGLTRYFNMPGPGTTNPPTLPASPFGTAANFQTLAYSIAGGTEDGWAAITAANAMPFRSGAARNYILVTDEDRDASQAGLTYAGVLASMTATGTLLNAIVDATFTCSLTGQILGVASDGTCFAADGQGGFLTGINGIAIAGFGTTVADYVNMAWGTGGVAWNLNLLRVGGVTADSFTKAFIDVKIAEIQQAAPEPGSLALLGLGFAGLAAVRRRKAKA